jgi:uncharacterized protein (DUF2236 family)
MQAAHPLAVAGLLAHSGSLEDPYIRLARTAQVMNVITFGPRAEADRLSTLQQAALWQDYKLVGRLFGLRSSEMPGTLAELEEYGREMLSPRARETSFT